MVISRLMIPMQSKNKMESGKKKLVFSAVMVISTLVACEFALQLLSAVSPRIDALLSRPAPAIPVWIDDEIMGTRPNPDYGGHDEKGFRNTSVPEDVSIVAMGDSQTYGWGELAHHAWPQQLERLGKIVTYNMAWGGYGPTHSLLLLQEAIDLKPELIILAFYAGNDLYDSYSLVYDRGQLSNLKATDKDVLRGIVEAEAAEPLSKRIARLSSMGKKEEAKYVLKHGVFREFLATHSRLYGILRIIKYRVLYFPGLLSNGEDWESLKKEALKQKEYCQVVDNGRVRTVLTPSYRLCAVNLDDPTILEGLRISMEAIRLMEERCRKANVEFIVLLMPTKELVFKEVVYQDGEDVPETYKTLIENEKLFWHKTKQFLRRQDIFFIDALPVLRRCVHYSKNPYPVSWNGHPNPVGYRAISEHVLSELRSNKLLTMETR